MPMSIYKVKAIINKSIYECVFFKKFCITIEQLSYLIPDLAQSICINELNFKFVQIDCSPFALF